MSLIDINWRPDKRELRKFGLIALAVLGSVSIIFHFVLKIETTLPTVIFIAGLCIFIISLISAKATRIIYLAMTLAALPIGLVINILSMGVFYFLILTPLGLVFKAIGRDVLNRRFEAQVKSYWVKRKQIQNLERYFHQF
jgi:fumarate reductase subunit C